MTALTSHRQRALNAAAAVFSAAFLCAALDATPVFEVRLKLAPASVRRVLVLNRIGNIKHVSNSVASAFGLADRYGVLMQPQGSPAGGGPAEENGPSLQDLLPLWWRELGVRYLQEYATPIGTGSKLSSSAARSGSSTPLVFGPTLELRSLDGQPLYMRLALQSCDISGEKLTVVHLRESTLAAAVDERRLKLQVSSDGRIMGVSPGTPKALFGFLPRKVRFLKMGSCCLFTFAITE